MFQKYPEKCYTTLPVRRLKSVSTLPSGGFRTLKVSSLFIPLALLILVGFYAPSVLAQTLRGTVSDADGRAVEGARISVVGTKFGAITDAKGRYTLNLGRGTYSLTASYLRFAKITQPVELANEAPQAAQILDFHFAEKGVVSENVLVQSVRAGIDAPIAQTNISAASIDETFQGQDPQYLLEKSTPSLIAFSEAGTNFSNYGSFRLRGIDQTRINMTLNGVPLNDMIDQGVFFSNITDFTNSIRSIQVQRGVGASSNGTSSYGGSINFESLNLREAAPGAEIQLGGGAFNLVRGSAEVRTGIMPSNVSIYAKYSTFGTDGYRMNTGTRGSSVFVSGAYFGENDILKLTGFLGRTQNGLAYLPVPKPLVDRDPRTNINDASDRDDFGQHFLQLEYSRALSGRSTLAASVYYGGSGGDFFVGFRDTANALTQINYPLRNDHIGAMVSLTSLSDDNALETTFGAHAYTFLRRNWETLMPDYTSIYYQDRTTKNEASIFAKATYRLGTLALYADVQARAVGMSFTSDARALSSQMPIPTHTWFFLNPKIGATIQMGDNTSIYASFGRTGREPTRFDMLGGTQIVDANVRVLTNPNTVRPEFVNDVEAGLRLVGNSVQAQVNGFYMHFQDEIAAIGAYIPQGFVQLRKNVPTSYRAGLEAEGEWTIHEMLRLSGNATWMAAAISEYVPENLGTNEVFRNVRPVQTPSIMGSASIQFRPISTLTLEASGRYVGESFLELTNSRDFMLPAFFVLDTRLEWQFLGGNRINLVLHNVFNALYATSGGVAEFEGRTVPAYFVQAPRSLVAMLHWKL
ncbi:MAG: TonB-dependent receptor [Candidatus Kapaibacteriota bacterium]